MANFNSPRIAYNYPVPVADRAGEVISVKATYEITAALALNDTVSLLTLPAGHVPVDCILFTDDLDTNGTPLIVLDVGYFGADTDALIDGATTGQTGGMTRMNVSTAIEAGAATTDRVVSVLVQAGPATGATSGTVGLQLNYRAEQTDE